MSDNTAVHASVEIRDGNIYLNIRALDGAGMTVGLTPDEAMEFALMLHAAAGAALDIEPVDDEDDEGVAA